MLKCRLKQGFYYYNFYNTAKQYNCHDKYFNHLVWIVKNKIIVEYQGQLINFIKVSKYHPDNLVIVNFEVISDFRSSKK